MKTIVYTLAAFISLVSVTMAQQAPAPSTQAATEDANRVIGVLQEQRNNALDQAAAARIATAKVQSELAAVHKELADLKAKGEAPAPPSSASAK